MVNEQPPGEEELSAERTLVHRIRAIARGDQPFDPDYPCWAQAAKQGQK